MKHSQSGIVGVSPYKKRCSDEQAGWRASWVEHTDDGYQRKTQDFSFFRHGDHALARAMRCRQEAVKRAMRRSDQEI